MIELRESIKQANTIVLKMDNVITGHQFSYWQRFVGKTGLILIIGDILLKFNPLFGNDWSDEMIELMADEISIDYWMVRPTELIFILKELSRKKQFGKINYNHISSSISQYLERRSEHMDEKHRAVKNSAPGIGSDKTTRGLQKLSGVIDTIKTTIPIIRSEENNQKQ